MCAIFGTIGNANLNLLKEISQKQIYRGPDKQSFFVSSDNLVSMGNNRLSVIDKKNGSQPMYSNNKRFVTVFNGCIYNFNEIRKFLQKKGIDFFTNSDTEVLVNAFQHFGNKTFNYFDGMWAVAIYDQENKQVTLSRDYVGQKPLFYTKSTNYYIFSSQLDGLLVDKKISPKISNVNLKKYFAYSHVPAPNTIFDNIYQVQPGENLLIDANNLKLEKKIYWDLLNGPDYNIFFSKIETKDFKEKFKKVVADHTIADKAPALSLSGGIDSYLIMDQLNNLKKDFSTFTLGFENKTFDEARFVKKIKTDVMKEIFYTNEDEMKKSFLEIANLLSDPIGDSSILPTYIIHKSIKTYSNVNLGGDGGDESFFGYITFDAYNFAIKIKKLVPNFIFKIISKCVNLTLISYDYLSFSTKIRKFFNFIHLDKKYILPSWMGCLKIKEFNDLFNEKLTESIIYESSNKIFSNNNIVRNSQLYYFKFYLPMILKKIDQASMYNSVESRSPFLSKIIINFSLDQDIDQIYKIFVKKYFIKKNFDKVIPKEILIRKKHGFALPKDILLRDKAFVNNLLDYNILLNKNFFISKYNNYLNKKDDCGEYIWNELVLNLTIQNFYKNRPDLKN